MKRKAFHFKKVDVTEADQLNRSVDDLYKHKIEEVIHSNSASETTLNTYRLTETGFEVDNFITATSIYKTIPYNQKFAQVFSIQLTPVGSAAEVHLISFTASEFVVKVNAETTATKSRFFWRVTGSQK